MAINFLARWVIILNMRSKNYAIIGMQTARSTDFGHLWARWMRQRQIQLYLRTFFFWGGSFERAEALERIYHLPFEVVSIIWLIYMVLCRYLRAEPSVRATSSRNGGQRATFILYRNPKGLKLNLCEKQRHSQKRRWVPPQPPKRWYFPTSQVWTLSLKPAQPEKNI